MSEIVYTDPVDLSAVPVTDSAYDRVTGMDVRIDRVGEGDPVVFLNGLLGLNEHWFGCLGPVAHDNECLLVQPPLLEMRGKGCSVDGVTRLTISLLDSLTETPPVLVGNSLGGHISLRIALERPEMVRGIVLIGSSGLFERTFERSGVEHRPSYQWLEQKITSLFYDPRCMHPRMVERAHEELSRRSAARAFVKLGGSAKKDHLGEQLPNVKAPTLLVWGREDNVTPPEVAEQFHDLIPNSELVWIEKCGHAPQIEQPTKVAHAIARFVRRLAAEESARSGEDDAQQEVA